MSNESTDRDAEQDALIRQNTENILRNQEAIRRQTDALEKIRDHYFPRKTLWKRASEFFLKAVGAVTVAAGLLEAADWLWNTRQAENMASESAAVAKRLFMEENDVAGAMKFLEKAVELDGDTLKYRIRLAYLKGMSTVADLFDLGRPLTPAERGRVDEILAEAVYLQNVASGEPMPHVLAAQARMLRGEKAAAVESAEHAVALDSSNVQAHITACVMNFLSGKTDNACRHLAAAEHLNPDFPLVLYWKAQMALVVSNRPEEAVAYADVLVRRVPKMAIGHVLRGTALEATGAGAKARASFAEALKLLPGLTRAMVPMAASYAREGNAVMARLWLDRALEADPNCMAALVTRGTVDDLTKAIGLAPFRADLYRARAKAHEAAGSGGGDEDVKTAEALEKSEKGTL